MSGDDRERAILEAFERLLEEKALHAISIDEVARGAGISRPTFYFYFASKDAVLLTLLDRVVAEADAATLDASLLPAAGPREGWRRTMRTRPRHEYWDVAIAGWRSGGASPT